MYARTCSFVGKLFTTSRLPDLRSALDKVDGNCTGLAPGPALLSAMSFSRRSSQQNPPNLSPSPATYGGRKMVDAFFRGRLLSVAADLRHGTSHSTFPLSLAAEIKRL